jgi:uncharacterized protein YkwD
LGSAAGGLATSGRGAPPVGTGAAGRPVTGGPTSAGTTAAPPATPGGGRSGGAAGSPVVVPPPTAGTVAPPAGGAAAPATGDRSPEGTCTRWKADRADLSEGTWSGNVMACDPGDISANGRANALRVLNLYRWLADMPAITNDPTMDKQAQACALIQRANGMLTHTPAETATCYMAEGATASGRCNISSGPGVSSVDGYMVDPGNDTTIGHRRWLLSNSIGPTGLGSTDMHSCLMTFGKMKVGKPWMAWPSPGAIPLQALTAKYSGTVDTTGWSLQSDTINLASAAITVTVDGAAQPVTITQLMGGYGSKYALRFNPMGWKTAAGKTYAVAVTGITPPINYEVQIVDCK